MEQKRQEILEMEKKCLPVRHYLFKFILPSVADGLVQCAKLRPKEPVEFLANFLISQGSNNIDESADLDEEVVDEFRRIVETSKCDE